MRTLTDLAWVVRAPTVRAARTRVARSLSVHADGGWDLAGDGWNLARGDWGLARGGWGLAGDGWGLAGGAWAGVVETEDGYELRGGLVGQRLGGRV